VLQKINKIIFLGVTKKNNLYKLFFGAPENKQKEMFTLKKEDVYDNFIKNSKEIINLINL
jgi:hypothetical protein